MPAYFTYVSGAAHRDRLRNLFKYSAPHYIPGIGVVAISLQECYYADPDAVEAAGDLVQELQREGIAVYLLGFHARVREVLEYAHWFHLVESFPDYGALLSHLRALQAEGRLPVRPPPPLPLAGSEGAGGSSSGPIDESAGAEGADVADLAAAAEDDEEGEASPNGDAVAEGGAAPSSLASGNDTLFGASRSGDLGASEAMDTGVFARHGRGAGKTASPLLGSSAASGPPGQRPPQRLA